MFGAALTYIDIDILWNFACILVAQSCHKLACEMHTSCFLIRVFLRCISCVCCSFSSWLIITILICYILFQFMSTCDHLRSLLCHAVHLPAQPADERLSKALWIGLILAQTLSRESGQSTSFLMCIKSVRRVLVSMCKSHLELLAEAVGTKDGKGSCLVLTCIDSRLASNGKHYQSREGRA